MQKHPGKCYLKLQILGSGNLHAGAHGGSHGAGTDILALGSGGLGLQDGGHQGVEVVLDLLGAEGSLAQGLSLIHI